MPPKMSNRQRKIAAMFAADSEEENEMEKFELTNDDIANEFNPDRPQFKQTKEQALYGIWAKSSENNYGKKKRDFSAPVTFISGGLKEGEKRQRYDPEEEENMDDYDVEGRQTKETKPVTLHSVQKPKPKPSTSAVGTSGSGGHAYSLTAKQKQKEKMATQFGSFERHTKGIGMKLMKKMGYKVGKGLGRDNQGIVNPIEAMKRTKKAGLGAAGTERTKQSYIHFPTQDSEEEEEKDFKEQISRWRKDGVDRNQKKYVYKTVDELKKSGKKIKKKKDGNSGSETALSSALANVKVIDMTGREQKVFSGYHAIAGRHAVDPDASSSSDEDYDNDRQRAGKEGGFSCPELEHNLNMLLESTEQKILHNDRQHDYEKDRVVSLKHQQDQLRTTLQQEEEEIQKLERLLQVVCQCEDRSNSDVECESFLDELAEVFAELQEKYFAEYKMFELSDLATAFVIPQMKKYFASWNPLKSPSHGTSEMKRWKTLLELDAASYSLQNSMSNTSNSDMYQYLVWEVWMPRVRTATYQWNVRDCDSMVELVEQWMPLLPSWILENLLMQLILPRLQQEVESWNPLTDPVPLHSWIHPWLPLLEQKMEPLYAPIRQKLGNALQMWHPRDPSAKVILEPWHEVFSRGSWDAFIIKNIVPKLEKCLRDFIVNPHDQSLADFQCVMEWESLIPRPSLVSMLETNFFPKWLRALSSWLNSSNVDYEEVSRWYTGWKKTLPEGLMTNSFVKDRFKQALEMMNRAVTGRPPRNVDMDAEDFEPNRAAAPARPSHPLSQSVQSSSVPMNFRDLIQQRAEERGLVFVPLKSNPDGKTVYRLGSRAVYIDRSVIYMKEGDAFLPLGLSAALDKASVG
uniref:tuftelin-interacting protein 11-like n=1 Tax=Styela clava TaxID=7725 RepID=UPI00193944C8|nr:tuftelin-interacting protein 11-like [Styela clava]XP_039257716.1 tuftelin-interacting protein 11-like [Styela clava]XP_039257717.1 tuftelin-interacting protein 11-like [Styela clava]